MYNVQKLYGKCPQSIGGVVVTTESSILANEILITIGKSGDLESTISMVTKLIDSIISDTKALKTREQLKSKYGLDMGSCIVGGFIEDSQGVIMAVLKRYKSSESLVRSSVVGYLSGEHDFHTCPLTVLLLVLKDAVPDPERLLVAEFNIPRTNEQLTNMGYMGLIDS